MYKDDYSFPVFMKSASFWTDKIFDSRGIILSQAEIRKFNIKLKPIISSLYSLDMRDEIISTKIITKYLQSYKLPAKDMYDSKGELIHSDYYENIIRKIDLFGLKDHTIAKYGISIRKTSIRSFPVEEPIFSSIEHSKINNFDRFQETGCFPYEPLLILHESIDKKWCFIKIYNYFGWVKTDDIAIAENKQEILDYAKCEDFLMVTGKELTLTINEKESSSINIKCGMGTKLCYINSVSSNSSENYIVNIPTRNSSGNLSFVSAIINKNEDIIKGNLPYTRYNILNQALKFIDTPYDWGDKFSGKDCSSLILTIYKCFGFLLPRNADDQEKSFFDTGNSVLFKKDDTIKNRYSKIDKLKPGAALFMQEHVMMYLGKYKGDHYMIHSFAGYSVKKRSSYEPRSSLLVAISLVDLLTAYGVPFIEEFTSAVHYQ